MNYRPEFDGLRAVAVLAVILNHLDSRLLPGGFLGVDVFFVISGYVVTSSLARAEESSWSAWLATFYSRRVKRLLPALVLCVVGTAIAGRLLIRGPEESLRTGMAALAAASNLYLWNQATDYFSPSADLNLFTHTWSLGAEEQFYFVFPCLLALCGFAHRLSEKREARAMAAILVLTIASLSYFIFLSGPRPASAFFLMPARFWELGLGALAFLAAERWPRSAAPTWSGPRATLSLLVILGALFLGKEQQTNATLLVGFLTASLLWSLQGPSLARRALSMSVLVRIGLISYSLYLWHWPVAVLARWTVGISLGIAPLLILLIGALAAASYSLVERPLRHARWSASALGTIGRALLGSLLAFAVLNWLLLPLAGSMFLGDRSRQVQLQQRGAVSLGEPWSHNGKVVWEAGRCVLQTSRDVGKAVEFDGCTFGDWRNARRRVLVLGDSYAVAEIGMLQTLIENGAFSFTVTASWGAAPAKGIASRPGWSEANADYWGRIVPGLVARLRPLDVVLIITDLSEYAPTESSVAASAKVEEVVSAVEAFAEDLSGRQVNLVFQSMIPFMRETGCTPETSVNPWSRLPTADNPACRFLTRSQTLKRRAEFHQALLRVQQRRTHFRVLDIIDVLCPGSTCRYTSPDGRFLFRDEFGHTSVVGATLAAPTLRSVLGGPADPLLNPVGDVPVSRLKNRAK